MTLDTAMPDLVANTSYPNSENLINFEKRRKEFEVIACLNILQMNCSQNRYVPACGMFTRWIESIVNLSESQMYEISYLIENDKPHVQQNENHELDANSSNVMTTSNNSFEDTDSKNENHKKSHNSIKRTLSGLIHFNHNNNSNSKHEEKYSLNHPNSQFNNQSIDSSISDDSGVKLQDVSTVYAAQSQFQPPLPQNEMIEHSKNSNKYSLSLPQNHNINSPTINIKQKLGKTNMNLIRLNSGLDTNSDKVKLRSTSPGNGSIGLG